MNLCAKDHDQVCYEVSVCPVCMVLEELERIRVEMVINEVATAEISIARNSLASVFDETRLRE